MTEGREKYEIATLAFGGRAMIVPLVVIARSEATKQSILRLPRLLRSRRLAMTERVRLPRPLLIGSHLWVFDMIFVSPTYINPFP